MAITGFVDHYTNRRYHKALSNVTPDDVLKGSREEILIKRREVKAQPLAQRKRYNRLLRESQNAAISPSSPLNKSVPLLLVANTYKARELPGTTQIWSQRAGPLKPSMIFFDPGSVVFPTSRYPYFVGLRD